MQAMVKSGHRSRWHVEAKRRQNLAARMRSQAADNTDATKMPVPVADSQLKSNVAGSGAIISPAFAAGTTGGDRRMRSFRPGTMNRSELVALSQALMCVSPQRNTNTDSSSH